MVSPEFLKVVKVLKVLKFSYLVVRNVQDAQICLMVRRKRYVRSEITECCDAIVAQIQLFEVG